MNQLSWLLTEHEWLQIEQAAKGCIGGELSEWPDLLEALKKLRISVQPLTKADTIRTVCATLMTVRILLDEVE